MHGHRDVCGDWAHFGLDYLGGKPMSEIILILGALSVGAGIVWAARLSKRESAVKRKEIEDELSEIDKKIRNTELSDLVKRNNDKYGGGTSH